MHTNEISVLIGGDCELAQGVANYFAEHGIIVRNTTRNPLDIQREAFLSKPNVVIISNRTKLNYELCECLKMIDNPPKIIIVINNSDYYNPSHIEDLADIIIENGTDFEMLYKQVLSFTFCDISTNQTQSVREINSQNKPGKEKMDLHTEVTQLLSRLCVTPNYNGYSYIREAIKIAVCDNNAIKGISKQIYPEIAQRLNVTSSGVERSIRTAIHRSWEKVKAPDRIDIFGTYAMQSDWIPTNSEYIFIIADRLGCKIKAQLRE